MKKISYIITVTLIVFFSATVIAQGNISETQQRYVADEVIVKFKSSTINLQKSSGIVSLQNFASSQNLISEDIISAQNISVMKIDDSQNVVDVIQGLQNNSSIEYVQPNFIYTIQTTNPNDTHFDVQRGLKNIGQNWGINGDDIQRNEAMDIWSGDGNQATTGTLIAIIDDGLRYTHPDFNGQLRDGGSCVDPMGDILGNCIFGYDAVAGDKDPQSYGNDTHGTHVAGIIGAKTNNGIWVAWTNPWAKIMAVRAGSGGELTTADIIEAISFAKYNRAKIINASRWGTGNSCAMVYDISLYQSIRDFPGLFVAAAGNAGHQHLNNRYGFPADYNKDTSCRSWLNNIITVAASDNKDSKASFSDYGSNINIFAPWVYIASTIHTWNYAYMDGTSMATPFVVAVASLARSMRPELSYLQIKDAIINQAEFVSALSGFVAGGKRLNVFRTLQYLYQAQIGWLSWYIGTWTGSSFVSGAYISGVQVYFQRQAPYFTGTLSGYRVSIMYSGQSFLETWIITTWIMVSLSGDGKYIFYTWPILSGGATWNTLAHTFYLDNTAPQTITWIAPLDNQILGYQQLQFSRTTCNEIFCRYFYKIFPSGSDVGILSWSTESTGIIFNDIIANGIYHWIVWPQDSAGNIWWYSVTGIFIYNVPDAFNFLEQTNTELSTSYQSNEIILSGLITWSQITIVWGTYTTSGGVYTWNTGLVVSWDKIRINLLSSAAYSTKTTATINIWWRTGTFETTTKANPWWGWWWGWWWGGWWTPPPIIPTCISTNLVCTNNVYLLKTWATCEWGKLGTSCGSVTSWSTGTIPTIHLFTPSKASVIGSHFSTELNTAYLYAYKIGITTLPTIQQADLTGVLVRRYLAKMISNFAIKQLGKTPNTWMVCDFTDIENQNAEIQFYIKLACQLGLMGLDADGIPVKLFSPKEEVNRAQFGTVLSRTLRGNQYNGGEPFYSNHLDALQKAEIMKYIDAPGNKELREYVMLMLMRSVE